MILVYELLFMNIYMLHLFSKCFGIVYNSLVYGKLGFK